MNATKTVTKHVSHTGRLVGYQFTEGGQWVGYRDVNGKRKKLTDRYLVSKGYTIVVAS